mmetsp:Transcript_14275/g.43116  ORF Transcript_14275/g.43116 Transcript_14275/m.43116 type:complete len:209 (-) Transcript_14275:1208-1834(-)
MAVSGRIYQAALRPQSGSCGAAIYAVRPVLRGRGVAPCGANRRCCAVRAPHAGVCAHITRAEGDHSEDFACGRCYNPHVRGRHQRCGCAQGRTRRRCPARAQQGRRDCGRKAESHSGRAGSSWRAWRPGPRPGTAAERGRQQQQRQRYRQRYSAASWRRGRRRPGWWTGRPGRPRWGGHPHAGGGAQAGTAHHAQAAGDGRLAGQLGG